MEYLSNFDLVDEKEVIYKEDHFFKNMSRDKFNRIKRNNASNNPAPGHYHPDKWHQKPDQLNLWHDTVTKKKPVGYKISKTSKDKYIWGY